ncbi:redox-active disulfide protein 2 [Sulfurimonas gotlandica GD1]|jgi:small redox-active disulfide protein 2|uniref:Redox-active disulfide protein 2 n=1 Tax=Sulfurimonas gotlandica (strain DSM 19862 / JCM 16533 / GD1) TaxID=929558 RepID=B6BLU9_SULGG|nr:thioredoxin family protein [Sulfurimonas gotlandica]EDZ61802.1 redox-active disulfide protein 2 [Sulfurimonas gotlandica GD1]EHP29479.1 redox-active disulfide protein 2 [Sulfurimonas gotlandica GD1]
MKIEILGTGCAKCKTLEEVAKQAVAKIGGFHSVIKVDDIQKIMDYGVMNTPGLVVDGVVKSTGKVLSVDEAIALMQA